MVLTKDLNDMMEGKKKLHDITYRWLDHNNRPIWIDVRKGKVSYY